jgi:hypothetical protein
MPTFSLDGPKKIDAGATGLSSHSFDFVNTSPYPICDLMVHTFDDDFYGASPDILPNGVSIDRFDPAPGPGGQVGQTNVTPLSKGSHWAPNQRR